MALSALPQAALAAGACPTRMDNLDDFAHCMVPLKGTVGTAAVYASGDYDESHRKLMRAMSLSNVTPPQVIPAGVPAIGYYSPYFAIGHAMLAGYYGVRAPYAINPYWYGYRR
jgi:hypothetical protein